MEWNFKSDHSAIFKREEKILPKLGLEHRFLSLHFSVNLKLDFIWYFYINVSMKPFAERKEMTIIYFHVHQNKMYKNMWKIASCKFKLARFIDLSLLIYKYLFVCLIVYFLLLVSLFIIYLLAYFLLVNFIYLL